MVAKDIHTQFSDLRSEVGRLKSQLERRFGTRLDSEFREVEDKLDGMDELLGIYGGRAGAKPLNEDEEMFGPDV